MTVSDETDCSRADEMSRAVDDLGAFVESSARFKGLAERRERLASLARSLSLQNKNLNGSLLVLLLGGTGVGKSTIINAIAGRPVAEASVIRPCTRRITFYTHEENDLSPIRSVISDADALETHHDEGLRRKILIDPPDFDSTVPENRAVLERVLSVSDLVVVVADREKYRNDSLYSLLSSHATGKSFVFVLNKADLLFDPAVLDDFRTSVESAGFRSPRMFAVSAKDALEGRRSQARDFEALENVLKAGIDRVRIREIKESNIGGLLRHAVAEVGRGIPADAPSRIASWRAECESEVRLAAAAAAAEIHSSVFLGDMPLAESALKSRALDVGGIFGAYLAVRERLSALTGPRALGAAGLGLDNPETAVALRIERVDRARISRLVETAALRIKERAGDAGLLAVPGLEDGRAAHAIGADVASDAAARFSELAPGPRREGAVSLRDVAYNLMPVGLVCYMVFHMLSRLFSGKELPGLEFIAGGLFLLVVLCAAQGALLDAGLARRARRLTAAMEAQTSAAALSRLRKILSAPVEDWATAAAAEFARFESIRERVSKCPE